MRAYNSDRVANDPIILHWIKPGTTDMPLCGVLAGFYKTPKYTKTKAEITCRRCKKFLGITS